MAPSTLAALAGLLGGGGGGGGAAATAASAAFPWGAALIGGSNVLSTGISTIFGKQDEYQIPQFQEYRDNFSRMRYENGDIYFKPKISRTQRRTMSQTDRGIYKAVKGLNRPFNVNEMYNNKFYNNTLDMLNRPIQHQRAQDQQEFNNRMGAMNQIGSSYDAYNRSLMDRRYDDMFQNAQNQARQASADAYQTQFNNNLSALGALRGDRSAAQQSLYYPTQMAQYFIRR